MPQNLLGAISYTVRPGDTIWQIAQRFRTTVFSIAAINPGLDLNHINVGQEIYILPNSDYYPHTPHFGSERISKAEEALKNHLRLLQNPRDFYLALRPLYGNRIASKFADLFTSHLVIAAQLVRAAKAGNTAAAEDAERKWYANADEIAAFLGSINPFWSSNQWRAMLHQYLELTKNEAVNILTQNYSEGISTFDKIERQALEMTDMMAHGIIRQFPDII